MLDAKITLTRHLVDTIKKARIDNNIKAADLSESIGRTVSYISSIENGRIAKIAAKDLIAIFMKIFSISEEDSILKIEEIIKSSSPTEQNNIDFDDSENTTTDEINAEQKVIKYKDLDELINPIDFNKMLKSINKAFMAYYKHNSKDAFLTANNLIGSFRSDIGFTMLILSLPYASLDDVPHDEKQKLLDSLIELFKPYFEKALKRDE